ncbi:MAG: Uma2 family endonuclease [Chloroflexaceae bacterium]|nr:Uma2 family endonuclease [Chloroflexaceae bacterium]
MSLPTTTVEVPTTARGRDLRRNEGHNRERQLPHPRGAEPAPDLTYPDSDGQPMADNTLQFEWIVTIKSGLEALFSHRDDVFVAGDLLWYPVQGRPDLRRAPDALVAFGRPRGYRGSYRQWEEGGIAPQVVFEVLSPGNRLMEMARKFEFYDEYGVEEYYLYDPEEGVLLGWQRVDGMLRVIEPMQGWVSPHLGIRFELVEGELQLLRPDGERFLTYLELLQQRDQERERADALAAKLREIGVDPDTVLSPRTPR